MKLRLLDIVSVLAILLLVIFLYFVYFDNTIDNTANEYLNETLILGFCPTMKDEAINLQSKNSNIKLKQYPSTLNVLEDLNSGKIDIALVGRVAQSTELKEGFYEHRLDEGFTLITSKKSGILYNQLSNIRIHTYLKEEDIKTLFDDTQNIVYHESIEDAIKIGINEAVLIDWKDYKDEYELLVPIDENNNKIRGFRIPVLYSYKNTNLDKLN